MIDNGTRLDIVLNRLCLTRSRNEAKTACDAGAVMVDDRPAKPSQTVMPGQRFTLHYANRTLEIRIVEIPGKSTSKKAAREMYEVLRDEPAGRAE